MEKLDIHIQDDLYFIQTIGQLKLFKEAYN